MGPIGLASVHRLINFTAGVRVMDNYAECIFIAGDWYASVENVKCGRRRIIENYEYIVVDIESVQIRRLKINFGVLK